MLDNCILHFADEDNTIWGAKFSEKHSILSKIA